VLDTAPEDNLVLKALNLFKAQYPVPPSAVYLRKAIPFGAGLGGGSADADFMLKLLDAYADTRLSVAELEAMAAGIGADCPFFIRNRPVIVSGTGTILEPVELSLKGYTLCIVKPEIFVSTKAAYSLVTPAVPSRPLTEIISTPLPDWKNQLVNDFEPGIFRLHPAIRGIKEQFYAQGAVYAAMSGSGSSVFGLFEEDAPLVFPDCFIWKGTLE
jgi:4-diphosphocytidyl-2-C-methyl-D-erythritol kinase